MQGHNQDTENLISIEKTRVKCENNSVTDNMQLGLVNRNNDDYCKATKCRSSSLPSAFYQQDSWKFVYTDSCETLLSKSECSLKHYVKRRCHISELATFMTTTNTDMDVDILSTGVDNANKDISLKISSPTNMNLLFKDRVSTYQQDSEKPPINVPANSKRHQSYSVNPLQCYVLSPCKQTDATSMSCFNRSCTKTMKERITLDSKKKTNINRFDSINDKPCNSFKDVSTRNKAIELSVKPISKSHIRCVIKCRKTCFRKKSIHLENIKTKTIPFGSDKPAASKNSCGLECEKRLMSAERHKRKLAQSRERRATLVLVLVMVAFILCWLPFFLIYVISAFCVQRCIPDFVFKVFFWIGYCNSAFNPLIYAVFNRDFRSAFRRILCPCLNRIRGGR